MTHYELLTTLQRILYDLRALHRQDPAGYCRECLHDWPCKSFKLADMKDPEQ